MVGALSREARELLHWLGLISEGVLVEEAVLRRGAGEERGVVMFRLSMEIC